MKSELKTINLSSDCSSVGNAATSDTQDLRFESSQQ